MIQSAKNEVFGDYLEFGLVDWLDIAYYDNSKWPQHFGIEIVHAGSFKNHKNIFWNAPKMRFLVPY